MIKVELEQNTKEWLDFRRSHIGASDATIIMGVSPWRTPYQLWEEKLQLREGQEENSSMRRGKDLESIALQKYNEVTKNCCSPGVFLHEKFKWMMASFDGISQDKSISVEIKCPGNEDHEMAKKGEVPKKYYPQLQHQLAVINTKMLHYFSYKDDDFALIEVHRDEGYLEKLYEAESKFLKCMKNMDPPELTEMDFIQRHDGVWLDLASQWIDLYQKKKELEEEEERFRHYLNQLSDGKNCRGGGIQVYHVKRKGNVDYKIIPELKDVDLDKYRKQGSVSIRITME